MRGSFAQAPTSAEAAAFVSEALTMENPPLRLQTSERARAFVGMKIADLDGAAVTTLTGSWVR